jgi:hypothetical protein
VFAPLAVIVALVSGHKVLLVGVIVMVGGALTVILILVVLVPTQAPVLVPVTV